MNFTTAKLIWKTTSQCGWSAQVRLPRPLTCHCANDACASCFHQGSLHPDPSLKRSPVAEKGLGTKGTMTTKGLGTTMTMAVMTSRNGDERWRQENKDRRWSQRQFSQCSNPRVSTDFNSLAASCQLVVVTFTRILKRGTTFLWFCFSLAHNVRLLPTQLDYFPKSAIGNWFIYL